MSGDEGATPRERVIEACRRDNDELIDEVLGEMKDMGATKEVIAEFFNNIQDGMGDYALHICAKYGSYDVMDKLFDIQHLECDPRTRVDRNAPLHVAVGYANDNDPELGGAMIQMMMEAGCDPRVRNRHNMKAIDLAGHHLTDIKKMLEQEEITLFSGIREQVAAEEADDPHANDPNYNSASDSE